MVPKVYMEGTMGKGKVLVPKSWVGAIRSQSELVGLVRGRRVLAEVRGQERVKVELE